MALLPADFQQLNPLENLMIMLVGILDGESKIAEADRTMSSDNIDQINLVLNDTLVAIDNIINPAV